MHLLHAFSCRKILFCGLVLAQVPGFSGAGFWGVDSAGSGYGTGQGSWFSGAGSWGVDSAGYGYGTAQGSWDE
jgi:hypothetical protein